MDVTKLYYYQEDLIRKINKNNIILVEWNTGRGLDITLEYYINTHENLNFCYMGFKLLYDMSYKNLNVSYISYYSFEHIFGKKIDILIFEMTNHLDYKKIIDYCLANNIKIIIKANYNTIDLVDYDYVYSNGKITLEKDRLQKLERILEDEN